MPLALLALTISAFAIGTTEFVIVGLIPTIAEQLGVNVPSAGLLVTIYALGVAIGAPVLTALTSRIPRKLLLVGLMALFTLGNLLAWQSPSYESLVIARLLTGLAHGVFFSIGSTIATSLVAKEKAASAIAIMFGGLTVALVTGVPLGTFIGQQFGWRETFLAVSLIGAVATVASIILVPNNIKNQGSAGVREQMKVLTHPRLLLIYAITALGYGGVFTTFTFLAPMMQELAGFSAPTVSWILLAYGVAVAVGNIWGGQAGRSPWGGACLELYLCRVGRFVTGVSVYRQPQYRRFADGDCDGRVRFRQRAGAAGLCGTKSRTIHAKCGGCGVRSQHRGVQHRHCAWFGDWRSDRCLAGAGADPLDWRADRGGCIVAG